MNCPLIAVASERSSAYGRSFIEGIAQYSESSADWDLTLVDADKIDPKQAKSYDGWICRTANSHAIDIIRRCKRPTVDALCVRTDTGFAKVRSDAKAIGKLAVEHFIARRFSNIAYCGYRRVLFSDRRRNAFAHILEARNIRPFIYRAPYTAQRYIDERLLIGDSVQTPRDAQDLLIWLKRLPKPVAIFCCDDIRASHIIAICKNLALAVPRDVAVLGIDNDPVYCMFSRPKISSIDPDCKRIGHEAAALLHRMINGGNIQDPPTLDIPPKGIVTRASTDTFLDAPEWFPEALSHIHRESVNGLTAADLFKFVGYSRTLVERTFKDILQTNVKQLIIQTRITEARRLLKQTSLSIKEVAHRSGFSSADYFVNTFTSFHGIPPGQWRSSGVDNNANELMKPKARHKTGPKNKLKRSRCHRTAQAAAEALSGFGAGEDFR